MPLLEGRKGRSREGCLTAAAGLRPGDEGEAPSSQKQEEHWTKRHPRRGRGDALPPRLCSPVPADHDGIFCSAQIRRCSPLYSYSWKKAPPPSTGEGRALVASGGRTKKSAQKEGSSALKRTTRTAVASRRSVVLLSSAGVTNVATGRTNCVASRRNPPPASLLLSRPR